MQVAATEGLGMLWGQAGARQPLGGGVGFLGTVHQKEALLHERCGGLAQGWEILILPGESRENEQEATGKGSNQEGVGGRQFGGRVLLDATNQGAKEEIQAAGAARCAQTSAVRRVPSAGPRLPPPRGPAPFAAHPPPAGIAAARRRASVIGWCPVG